MTSFNDGIEAAAKFLEEVVKNSPPASWWATAFEQAAEDIRALKRPEPSEAAKPKAQPMETAPKDGTKIALLVAGEWVAPCEWQKGGVISEKGFWLHWNFVEGSYFNEVLKPAGWFPLPDAPEGE